MAVSALDNLPKYLTDHKASGQIGQGEGEKAGVAYRMKDGSMVYVPEGK